MFNKQLKEELRDVRIREQVASAQADAYVRLYVQVMQAMKQCESFEEMKRQIDLANVELSGRLTGIATINCASICQ